MFVIDNKKLVIDDSIWVFHLDPNVTSIDELIYPKPYIYKGRYTNYNNDYIIINDAKTCEEIEIITINNFSQTETGNYIITNTRTDIIKKIRNVARRPALDITYKFIASEYLKYLQKEKPEWII